MSKITIDRNVLERALDGLDTVARELGIDWLRPEFADAGDAATALREALAQKTHEPVEADRVSRDVPAGWKWVPVELTAEMRAAAKPCTTVTQLWSALLAASPQPQQSGAPASASVAIDYRQAVELVEMFGGEPAEVRMIHGDGHSGPGLYAYYDELPEEGANFLGETDPDATPRPQPVCQTCSGHGMIGGPSFYAPDEGGVPCPDCNQPQPVQAQPSEQLEFLQQQIRDALHEMSCCNFNSAAERLRHTLDLPANQQKD